MRKALPILIAILLIFPAAAVEEHEVQGNYEGAFTSDRWKDDPVNAKVVAQGNGRYRVLLSFADDSVEFKGKTESEDANPTFSGPITLDGKEYSLSGSYEGGTIECTLKGSKNPAFKMQRVRNRPPTYDAKPPEGAIILIGDGNLDAFVADPPKWRSVEDGAVEVSNPNIISKHQFGDHKLHVEFRTPFMPRDRGQARGNSGVYVQGVYEIQVLDSFGLDPADNLCGGIYKIAVPSFNACLPPLEWQTYDITFHAPRFDADGKKTKNARLNVVHNGHTIHDDLELPTLTAGGIRGDEAPLGPLKLQHHNNPVRFRNVWAVPLD